MNIFNLYTTKQEALDFLDRLSDYSDALFSVKDKDKAWDKYFTKQEQEALCHPSSVIPESEVSRGSINNGTKVKKLLIELQREVQKVPKVYITLALDPTKLMIDQIQQKLSQALNTSFFLDVSIDRDIIGGAILSYEGVQRDYSIRNRII